MVDLYEFINEDYIIKDALYECFKDSIICPICSEIIVRPVMCMNCQKAYCKRCIEHWNNMKNYCPNKCNNPEYKKCILVGNILSKLNFKCKDCSNIVNYDKMERHALSKCETIEVNYKLINHDLNSDGIFKKVKIQTKDRKKLYSQPQTKMKSNYIYFLNYFLFFHYSSLPWIK